MRAPPSLLRAVPVVVAVGLLASCGTTRTKGVQSGLPSLSAVSHGRFVSTVDLDHGALEVQPPGGGKALVSTATATAMFRAADVVKGSYEFSIVGLGLVTVSPTVSTPSSTSTSTSTSSGATTTSTTTATRASPATTTTALTTTTTAAPVGTTSSAPGPAATGTGTTTPPSASSSTTPPPAGVGTPPLPGYDHRLAWVGIAWNAGCPTDTTGVPGSTLAGTGGASRYTVVIFDAETGRDVLAYTSGGRPPCGGAVQPPMVTRPAELVSVPWQPVDAASTAVQVSLPACATYYGWTQVQPGGVATAAIEVEALVPFDPDCATTSVNVVVDDVVPLGKAQAQVVHAPLGPVDAQRTLPGG